MTFKNHEIQRVEGDGYQPASAAADAHKVLELRLIAQYFRTSGFQHAVLLRRVIQQGHQIMQEILQRNRRGARTDPARRREYRQVVDHIAHHFEGGRARADDNPGPQFGDGNVRAAQGVRRQLARAQVVGLLAFGCLGELKITCFTGVCSRASRTFIAT